MRLLALTVLATALLCLQSPHASADDKKESKPKSSRTVRHLQTKTVLMNDDNTFDQKNITIDAGMSITWVQNGTKKHNATADDGSWTTGDLTRKGQSVTMQFNQPTGAAPIRYSCTHHKAMGMVGTITVIDAETRSHPLARHAYGALVLVGRSAIECVRIPNRTGGTFMGSRGVLHNDEDGRWFKEDYREGPGQARPVWSSVARKPGAGS